ncbi:hypothetical protein BT63DRAFT_76251 [Microthyrium microscopicum]|uniref:Ribonuclease H2 subunit B n=1 Tax=Microthyrium microscopicum TaxID=703497 RepID=A0A6A6U1L8_9PEZI|nr:hypothetical protein BT63DRAFT_76251 [Microthyrium microscopicum]
MPRTRSTKATTKDAPAPTPEITTKTLSSVDSNPPKLFILPKDISSEARIITLRDPVRNEPSRYYFCPQKGFHEFTRISAPRADPRSWLLVSENNQSSELDTTEGAQEESEESTAFKKQLNGYVSKSQDLFLATPFDSLFLILSIVAPGVATSKGDQKSMFLTLDDHIEKSEQSPALNELLRERECRKILEDRVRAICDIVEAGDDSMFRLSQEKLAKEIYGKARKLVQLGLPASLEDKFVTRPLQAPMMIIEKAKVETTLDTVVLDEATAAAESQTTLVSEVLESDASTLEKSTITSTTTTFESTTTIVDTPTEPSTEMTQLLRMRTALNFILRSYIRADLRGPILSSISTLKLIDFRPLDTHLQKLDADRASAAALRSISDNISRKRPADDDELADVNAEKKRKKDEEDKRKKAESRGVKDLRKVNTSGMKKLSSFFTKKPASKT